jgi:hypothetical protein
VGRVWKSWGPAVHTLVKKKLDLLPIWILRIQTPKSIFASVVSRHIRAACFTSLKPNGSTAGQRGQMSSAPDPDDSRPRQIERSGREPRLVQEGAQVGSSVAARIVSMIELDVRERAREGSAPSPADPHRIGPFGGWHFGSMAGLTLRGVVL